jgi:hypothetical protein
MLCREIIAVCSQIHTKHTNTLFVQNAELLNVKLVVLKSDHWALKGSPTYFTTHADHQTVLINMLRFINTH